MIKNCLNCDRKIYCYPSTLLKKKYCSKSCCDKHKTGKPNGQKGKKRPNLTGNKHPMFGKHPSKETLKKLSISHKGQIGYWTGKKRPDMSGEKHPNYKKNSLYGTRHDWISYHYGKASYCENLDCFYPRKDSKNRVLFKPKMFVWSNISGEYRRQRQDWQQLCQSCHIAYDKRFIPGACKRMRQSEGTLKNKENVSIKIVKQLEFGFLSGDQYSEGK